MTKDIPHLQEPVIRKDVTDTFFLKNMSDGHERGESLQITSSLSPGDKYISPLYPPCHPPI